LRAYYDSIGPQERPGFGYHDNNFIISEVRLEMAPRFPPAPRNPFLVHDEGSAHSRSASREDEQDSEILSSPPTESPSCVDVDFVDNPVVSTEETVIQEKLAGKETRRIGVWKFVVILLILLTAIGVVSGTYIVLDDFQEQNFQNAVSANWVK
jgi:hypothetical protein